MTPGEILNNRVWHLFEKAGFDTQPNSFDPTEYEIKLSTLGKRTPDLLAVEKKLKIRILGENSTTSKLKHSLTKNVNDLAELMRVDKAQAGLFVYPSMYFEEKDINYAATKNIQVWNEETLTYYEAIVEILGTYAKYELIHSFGLTTKEEQLIHNCLALKIQQPFEESAINLFLFTISPEKLLRSSIIFRRAQGNKDAYQRMVRKKKLRKIKKFVSQNEALLPTNIIVHFNEKISFSEIILPSKDQNNVPINLTSANSSVVVLNIPLKYGSLEILDGQHRLYGFIETEPATKANFNLVVLGLQELSQVQKRDTFIAINDNAQRIDPNLVTFLKLNEDENDCQKDTELMAIKVVYLLNKMEHSPFKGMIKMLDKGDQIITLKGFSGYDLKGLLGKSGLLRKYYPHNSSNYAEALKVFFLRIKSHFKKEYNNQSKYVIFTNKGISAFLKLLKSILKNEGKRIDDKIIDGYLSIIKRNSSNDEWETSKLKSKYVGAGGWKEFHRDLVRKIQSEIPSFEE